MTRSSVLSSTRRRGSISFVSTTNPAAPAHNRTHMCREGKQLLRSFRPCAAPQFSFESGNKGVYLNGSEPITYSFVAATSPTPRHHPTSSIGLRGHSTPASVDPVPSSSHRFLLASL